MSAGLFALSCPQCNGELEIDHRGMGLCAHCERTYLTRFGHLIPIDVLAAPTPDPPVFAPGPARRAGA